MPHIKADRIVILTTIIASISPLLMAVVNPDWTYWALAFPAMLLKPMGADGLFTVSILLISTVFPAKMQGLAGGVFNTISQIG
jgi:nitrate/nitrite transporter NarK